MVGHPRKRKPPFRQALVSIRIRWFRSASNDRGLRLIDQLSDPDDPDGDMRIV